MSLPLTILGGYLGAGKTTLVNRMLRDAGGRRLAILVNDFGDLAVDADLIEAESDDLIALAGGCVCCSYGDDLMAALLHLSAMDPAPDAVLLEASGVAMPATIGSAVALMPGIALAGIVVLADASRLPVLLADRYLADTIERQLAAADLIVVTKTDLGNAAVTEALLSQHVPACPIVHDQTVTTTLILARHIRRDKATALPGHSARHVTRLLPQTEIDDLPALAQALCADTSVVRAKGCVRTPEGVKLLQLVGEKATISDPPESAALGIVVIQVTV